MKRHRSLTIFLFFLSLFFFERNTQAGSNLPQARVRVAITGKNYKQLKQYFAPLESKPVELDRAIEKMLIAALPRDFQKGCQKMISSWGKAAKGTASKVLRIIYLKKYDDNLQQAILVYTCYSNSKQFGERFYDERLILLSIDSISSSLVTIPHGKPCTTCSELSRMGISEDTLRIGDRPAVSINVEVANDNPCCPTAISSRNVTVHYFTFDRDNMTEIISVVKHSSEIIHDSARGDSTTASDATITHEKDAAGNIIKIISLTEETTNERSVRQGITAYLWNRKSRGFQQANP